MEASKRQFERELHTKKRTIEKQLDNRRSSGSSKLSMGLEDDETPTTPFNQSLLAEESRPRNPELEQFTEKLKRELESNKKKLEESFKGISLLNTSSQPQSILKNTANHNESIDMTSPVSPAQMKKMQLEELQQSVKKDLNASLTILEAEEKKYATAAPPPRPTSRGSNRPEPGKLWNVEPDIDTRLARSVVGTSARKGSKRVEFSDSPLRDDLGMISPSVRVRTEPTFTNSLEEFKSRLLEQKERKEDINRLKHTIDSISSTPSRGFLEKSKFQIEKDLEESRRKITELKMRESRR